MKPLQIHKDWNVLKSSEPCKVKIKRWHVNLTFTLIAILSSDLMQCLALAEVRMAERSKALRSGRSPVFRAWVRIPLLTVHFYFQVNISFSWQTSCAINTNIQLTLIRLCRYRLTTCDQLFGRSKCRHKDFLRSGRTNIPALKVILTDGVFTPLCSVILPSHVIK